VPGERRRDEAELQAAILDTLTRCGALVSRNNVGVAAWKTGQRTRYGLGVGSGDLVVCYLGRYVEIEVKSATGRQTPEQAARARAVESAGGLYVLARSVTDVLRALGVPHRGTT
jgi:hypothetical protein